MTSRSQAHNMFSGPARSAKELMRADGEQFVRWAYITLLGRPADPEGLRFYLRRMDEGKTKVSIMKQLSRSAEGRAHGARLSDLQPLIRRAIIKRTPVVGTVYQWLVGGTQPPRLSPPSAFQGVETNR
ncbi:MAG: DUF4214 domain-containing protein [Sphingobium sp.]